MSVMELHKDEPTTRSEHVRVDLEKVSFMHQEEGITPLADEAEIALGKKVTRQTDFRMLPLLIFIYTLTFLDRVNIGNARLWHLEKDLGMTGIQFNIVTLGRSPTDQGQESTC
jgi:hypothetical protein